MQPIIVERQVTSQGVMASGMFGLSAGNEAHIFGILRNTLYANKELAVLREYSTNAWDAHVDGGIPDRPIKVVLPTPLEPSLVVRDFGPGLSEEDVFDIYTQYGASTKRSSNATAGYMGIGSKSAFAYSDSFTITSFHGGSKTIYVAVIDETHVGRVSKMHTEPCGDETGVEIKIPVKPTDIPAFEREAAALFPFFRPIPDVNIEVVPRVTDPRQNGFILEAVSKDDPDASRWIAVMGPVPYHLNFSKMPHELQAAGLEEIINHVRGGLYFEIGEVSVSASREELEYTPKTRAAVVRRLRLLFDELIGEFDRVASDPTVSDWTKRVAALQFVQTSCMPVPSKYAAWHGKAMLYSHDPHRDGDGNVKRNQEGQLVTSAPKTFRLNGYKMMTDRWGSNTGRRSSRMAEHPEIDVNPDARILIKDTDLSIKGYRLRWYDRVVVPQPHAEPEVLLAELREFLKAARLEGIPVEHLSNLPHDADAEEEDEDEEEETRSGRTRTHNVKHVQKHFVLRPDVRDAIPYSQNWDVVTRVPTKRDVYVVLARFEAVGSTNFYRRVDRDRRIFNVLGGKFPEVYGYKTTEKEPIDSTKLKGTVYKDWRDAEVKRLLAANPKVQELLENHRWAKVFEHHGFNAERTCDSIRIGLPDENHPVMKVFLRHSEAVARERKMSSSELQDLVTLFDDVNGDRRVDAPFGHPRSGRFVPRPNAPMWEADIQLAALYARYPLLDSQMGGPDFGVFHTEQRRKVWFDYIHLIDQVNP